MERHEKDRTGDKSRGHKAIHVSSGGFGPSRSGGSGVITDNKHQEGPY